MNPATRVADWQADIDFYAKELPRRHIDAFAHVERQEFERQVATLRERATEASDLELVVGLMQVTTLVHDAHTRVYPSGRVGAFSSVPLGLTWFADGIFVTHAQEERRDLIGSRVVAIGGLPVDEACRRVATTIPAENEAHLRHMMRSSLVQPELLRALGIGTSADAIDFTLAGADGIQRDVRMERIPPGAKVRLAGHFDPDDPALPVSWKRAAHRNRFEYLPRQRTLYVCYATCSNEEGQSVTRFTRGVLDFLDEHSEVERVVVDLRGNGGGDSLLGWHLILGLKSRPVNSPDRLAVLIGRGTFSSAQLNASEFRKWTRATLYGGPTGQKPNAYGEVKSFTLPRTGVIVQYSTERFETDPADPPSMMPDVLVEATSSAYFANRDPVLERAMAGPVVTPSSTSPGSERRQPP